MFNTLILSGGGSKCIAHLGALMQMEQSKKIENLRNYIGTSAGAFICYLLTLGYTPFEIFHHLISSSFVDEFRNFNLSALVHQRGFVSWEDKVASHLEFLTSKKLDFSPTFLDIRKRFKKELTVVTYNMSTNTVEYLNADTTPDLLVETGLRMSANVPFLFDRFFHNGFEYVDGGVVENFSIGYYDRPENTLIGLNVSTVEPPVVKKDSFYVYIFRLAMLPYTYYNHKRKYPPTVTVIDIDTGLNLIDFHLDVPKRLNTFSAGYQAARAFWTVREGGKEEVKEKVVVKDPVIEEAPAPQEGIAKEEVPVKEDTVKEEVPVKEVKNDPSV